MDTVAIDGVEYVKAAVLARAHGYTTDYIGQLCRGNKVDAHLVGRTWYVYPPSLDTHKTTRYSELRFGDKINTKELKTTLSRRNVIAPQVKSTIRAQPSNFTHRVFWRSQEYASDAEDLLPTLNRIGEDKTVTSMRIDLAESRQINIAGKSDNITLVSEPPPAIALAGTLKVQSYEPHFDVDTEISDEINSVENTSYVGKVAPVSSTKYRETVEPLEKSKGSVKPDFPVYDVPLKKQLIEHAPLTFSPKSVRVNKDMVSSSGPIFKRKETESQVEIVKLPPDPAHSLFFNLVIAPAMVLLVAMLAGSFFFVESLTEVNARGEQVKVLNLKASILDSFFSSK